MLPEIVIFAVLEHPMPVLHSLCYFWVCERSQRGSAANAKCGWEGEGVGGWVGKMAKKANVILERPLMHAEGLQRGIAEYASTRVHGHR